MKYYVIQVKTGNETKFKNDLLKNSNNNSLQAVQVYIPQRVLTIKRKGKKKDLQSALFPGYVFIEAEKLSVSLAKTITGSNGFLRILPENSRPSPLQGEEKEILKKLLHSGEIIAKSRVSFDENNRIRVIKGPLSGLEGKISKVDRRKGRAKVVLSLYDDKFTIDFGFTDISRQE